MSCRCDPGAERDAAIIATVIVAAVLVGLSCAGLVRAQQPDNAREKIKNIRKNSRPIGEPVDQYLPAKIWELDLGIYSRYTLKDPENPIEVGTLYVNTQQGQVHPGFSPPPWRTIRTSSLRPTPNRLNNYKVTHVVAPAGYGKSALLRYLEAALKPGAAPSHSPSPLADRLRKIREIPEKGNVDLITTVKLDELGGQFAVHTTMLDELKSDAGYPLAALREASGIRLRRPPGAGRRFLDRGVRPPRGKGERLPDPDHRQYRRDPPGERKVATSTASTSTSNNVREDNKRTAVPSLAASVYIFGRPEGLSGLLQDHPGGRSEGAAGRTAQPVRYQTKRNLKKAVELSVEYTLLGGERWQNVYDLKKKPEPALAKSHYKYEIHVSKDLTNNPRKLRFNIYDGDGECIELCEPEEAFVAFKDQLDKLLGNGAELDERDKVPVTKKVLSINATNRAINFMNDCCFPGCDLRLMRPGAALSDIPTSGQEPDHRGRGG